MCSLLNNFIFLYFASNKVWPYDSHCELFFIFTNKRHQSGVYVYGFCLLFSVSTLPRGRIVSPPRSLGDSKRSCFSVAITVKSMLPSWQRCRELTTNLKDYQMRPVLGIFRLFGRLDSKWPNEAFWATKRLIVYLVYVLTAIQFNSSTRAHWLAFSLVQGTPQQALTINPTSKLLFCLATCASK